MTTKARYVLDSVLVLLLLACLVAVGFLYRERNNLRTELRSATWDIFRLEQKNDNLIQPTVGAIQFLKYGYSVTLESADYVQDGLALSGVIGNPTNLTLTNVAINVAALEPIYSLYDRWMKRHLTLDEEFSGPRTIGHAQTVIPTLGPARTAPFRLTIPNVKQTKDPVALRVWFSGERYNY
jgi:hypothetical protein